MLTSGSLIEGRATPSATAAYAREAGAARGHFREALGVNVSSLGIGTYLGRDDDWTDAAYTVAVRRALQLGINVVDTAINYRNQRSERAVGRALREGGISRERVVVCTLTGHGLKDPDTALKNLSNTIVAEPDLKKLLKLLEG